MLMPVLRNIVVIEVENADKDNIREKPVARKEKLITTVNQRSRNQLSPSSYDAG